LSAATVTVRATDQFGRAIDRSFTLTVAAVAWSITENGADATVNSYPLVPGEPDWDVEGGDSITINAVPGNADFVVSFEASDFTDNELALGEYTVRVHAPNNVTGLTEDVAYRFHALQNPGPEIEIAAPAGIDAQFSAVNADGWSATYSSPPTFDPVGDPEVFTVTREGFDATGTATTLNEDLTVMARIREPYPDETDLTADQVSLSDFIYADDVVFGATNNSTRPYPKPIALWLHHDRERITSSSYTLRLAVAHAHARNGRPVAAVKFQLSDGTTIVEQTVSAMSVIEYASGLSVPHFAATMNTSTLNAAAELTVNAIIYPWIGAAFDISTDADTYPSPNLCTLRFLNDRTGSYGTAYAYVDSVSGNDGTGVTSPTASTAAASPYATISAAVTAVRTYNNANFSRNNAGGGIVRLVEGTHNHQAIRTPAGTTTWPLVIEAADPTKVATTIYLAPSSSSSNGMPDHIIFRNLTLRKQGASIIAFDNGATTAAPVMVFQGCDFDINGTPYYAAWIYRTGRGYLIECTGDNVGEGAPFSTVYKAMASIGCTSAGALLDGVYNAVGNISGPIPGLFSRGVSGSMPAGAGQFFGWNLLSKGSTSTPPITINLAVGDRGLAIVGNIVEAWGTLSVQALLVSGDGNTTAAQNVVIQGNTVVGQRFNGFYVDTAVNAVKSGYVAQNVFQKLNIKGDVFATTSTSVGNWPARYKVGWFKNAALQADNGTATGAYSAASWLGEIAGLGEVTGSDATPLDADWVNDQSNNGGDAGGGDYTPGPSSALPTITAAEALFSHDLYGNAIGAGSHIGAIAA
jgi:hypothetical protein